MMTKTFGLTPDSHSRIANTLEEACKTVERILDELGVAYPLASAEYQVAYKAHLTMEAFKASMIRARDKEREERGVK